MNTPQLQNWEEALDFLDRYAFDKKEEIDRRQLNKGLGLIKSYMLETSADEIHGKNDKFQLPRILEDTGWKISRFGDNGFFNISSGGEFIGFAENISDRHLAIHTFQETRQSDAIVRNAVRDGSVLDFVWLSPTYLNILWELVIRDQMQNRFVAFKFEHEKRFEDGAWVDDEQENVFDAQDGEEQIAVDHKASTLSIAAPVHRIANLLPNLQEVLADFRAIKMLRFPSQDTRGGYDFWDWGKVTYRAPIFRSGRDYVKEIVKNYQEITERIEKRIWFQTEVTKLSDGDTSFTLTGAPVSFIFSEPLTVNTFNAFVETTFDKGQGPFRLGGNPIRISEKQVQVYGLDLHLWQRIYLELTPRRFLAVLPKGTCGNTVHRLASNIQRYLSPDIKVHIGNVLYDDLILNVLLGRED